MITTKNSSVEMAVILSIESSASAGSLALHKEGKIIATTELYIERSHSSLLTVSVQKLLDLTGMSPSALDAVAISGGPGSFTGLRIGTSTAKGMCFSLDIPLINVDTLKVMAMEVSGFNVEGYHLCPMVDARRMEVYTALYDAALNEVMPTSALVIGEDSFANQLKDNKICFFGDGSDKFIETINSPNALHVKHVFPRAIHMGGMAYQKFVDKDFENVDDFEPNYLKPVYTTTPRKV